MPTKNVNLSDRQNRFISQTVKGGQFRNASEVVRTGLRLLEQQQAEDQLKLARLKRLATDAFDAMDRGDHVTVAVEELDDFLDSLGRAAKAGEGQVKYTLRLSRHAIRDLADMLAFTLEKFGEKQQAIYRRIIRDALKELAADPEGHRTKQRPEIHPDARTMHIARRGKHARHVFLYRVVNRQFVDIARLLHDSMDLAQHLPPDFETND